MHSGCRAEIDRLRAQAALFGAQREAVASQLAGLGVEYGTPDDYAIAAAGEIARLRAEVERLRMSRDEITKPLDVQIERLRAELEAARAALATERDQVSEYRKAVGAALGTASPSRIRRLLAGVLLRHDGRRAAEAKGETK